MTKVGTPVKLFIIDLRRVLADFLVTGLPSSLSVPGPLAALKEKYLATSKPFTYALPFTLSGQTDPSTNNALKAKMEFALYAHLVPVSHSARPLICSRVFCLQ